MRTGTRSRFRIASTATASGGETIAPSAKAAAQGRPSIKECATQATTVVVTKDEPNREEENPAQIAPEITPRSENRGRIKQRREKEKEDEIRIEPDNRKKRNKTQGQAAQDEQDRIRNGPFVGEDDQARHQHEQEARLVRRDA